ncbi:TonB family protein [Belliella sp. DSM 107340]|uniref:TonB family protein n=1 Tax=Belliella calami TaxID=2923436 RepID=A0ABS9UN93_9BACT|nr:TonB family protein [Belliella calami]MCH7398077.1 TonB family protein [Belliella calami]
MAILIDYIWQSTFCLFFFFGVYWVFLRNEKVFVFTRVYLLITPILGLLFPLVKIPVSFYKPDISLEQSQLFRALSIEQVPEDVAGFYGLPEVTVQSTKLPMLLELKDYFIIFYLLIFALLAVKVFWQFIQLRLLKEKGWYQTVFKLKEKYFLIPTFGLAPIFSYFNELYWDETQDLSNEEKDQIIKHEIEHIRQGHSWDILYYQIMSVVFWFNPAMHLMRSALVDVHEYLADENVLKQTANKENYPKLIVKIAFKGMDLPIGNYFIRSTTLKRILMMKNSKKPNRFKMIMILPLTLMLLALVSMKTKVGLNDLLSSSTQKIEFIKDQLTASQDSLEVAIKVKKIKNPNHYELIGPLEGEKLTAQLGELMYEFSEISSDDEYVKVRSLINSLKSNSRIVKNYGPVKTYGQVSVKPTPKEGEEVWEKNLAKSIAEFIPEKEMELGLISRIEIEYVITKDGSIKDPIIKQSFGGGVDKKVLDMLTNSDLPKWTPGELNGEKVEVVHSTSLNISLPSKISQNKDDLNFFPQTIDIPIYKSKNTVINDDTVFDVVETAPNPQGGMEGWNEYLKSNLRYPEVAKANGEEGTVYVVFEVNKDGSISEVDILRGVSPAIDAEAIRVVKASPAWEPGKQRGKEVNVRMRLPIRFNNDSKNATASSKDQVGEVVVFKDGAYDKVDTPPSPQGKMEGWKKYLTENLNYPNSAKEQGVEGTVYLVFVVGKDGSIGEVDVLRGIGAGCDEEAMRIVKNSPKWTPGMHDGNPVNVRMRLPIRFNLGKSSAASEEVSPTKAFNTHLTKNIKFPLEARKNENTGTVLVQLELDSKGKISNTEIIQGVSKEIDEEVNRVVNTSAPSWNVPLNGNSFKTILPITFRLGDVNSESRSREGMKNEIVVVGYGSSTSLQSKKVINDFENNQVNSTIFGKFDSSSKSKTFDPIYVLDGKIRDRDSMNKIEPTNIKNLNIVRNPSIDELGKFGEESKKGIIYVETKNK